MGRYCFFTLKPWLACFSCVDDVLGFPGGSAEKNPPATAGEAGLIPGFGRCPGEGSGNPLQYSRLENPMDSGDWRAKDVLGNIHGAGFLDLS